MNDLWFEPVGEVKNINAGKHERDGDQKPVSLGHKVWNVRRVARRVKA
jgi:hypothetical protein